MSPRDAAIAAARRGWAVFPCKPGRKDPAVPDHREDQCPRRGACRDGHKTPEQLACADPEVVARTWPGPGHNVGIAPGRCGLVVLDLDTHGGLPPDWQAELGIRDGRDVLAALCEWAGQPWPCTYSVVTPSDGWHLYYAAPEGHQIRNSAGKIGPMVDVRCRGGYVVGAGSVVDGLAYRVFDDDAPAPLPGWLVQMLAPRPDPPALRPGRCGSVPARLAGLVRTVETAPEGRRNDTLYWAACRAAELDGAREEAAGALLAAACSAGLGEAEARKTVTSAMGGTC